MILQNEHHRYPSIFYKLYLLVHPDLVDTYEEEIKNLIRIISFIDFDEEEGYTLKNLIDDDIRDHLNLDDVENTFEGFCKFYDKVLYNTLKAVRENDIEPFTVFDDYVGLAESLGPDITKIMLSYSMDSPGLTAYTFDRTLRKEHGNLSSDEFNAIFKKELELCYAAHMDDTYRAVLCHSDGTVIRTENIYGSRNLKEKLEEMFDIEFKEYKMFNEQEENIER